MTSNNSIFRLAAGAALGFLLAALGGCDPASVSAADRTGGTIPSGTAEPLAVYKSPTCGCCQGWIDRLDEDAFEVAIHHPEDMGAIKAKYGLVPQLQSCHTAVTSDGYVFEGHIPQKFVKRFLAEKPEGAVGLAVPGMPIGSPGMEAGRRFTPYQVLLLGEDGSVSLYANVQRLEDQYD